MGIRGLAYISRRLGIPLGAACVLAAVVTCAILLLEPPGGSPDAGELPVVELGQVSGGERDRFSTSSDQPAESGGNGEMSTTSTVAPDDQTGPSPATTDPHGSSLSSPSEAAGSSTSLSSPASNGTGYQFGKREVVGGELRVETGGGSGAGGAGAGR